MKKLIDVIPDWLTTGIFHYISIAAGSDLPWTTAAAVLDAEYIGNHSGSKLISPLIQRLLDTDDAAELSAARLQQLAGIIWNRYGVQWGRLYEVLSAEYDPIQNYSMTETEETEGTNTGTVGDSGTVSGTNTGTQGETYSSSGSNTGTVTEQGTEAHDVDRTSTSDTETEATHNIYGYDSATAAPADSDESTSSVTGSETVEEGVTKSNTRTDNLAHTDSGTSTRTDNLAHAETRSSTRTDNLAHEESRTLTREGNIGVTTSQQMLESEIALWQYDFFAIVYANLDKVLTIPVY